MLFRSHWQSSESARSGITCSQLARPSEFRSFRVRRFALRFVARSANLSPVVTLSRVCQGSVQGFVQGLKCRKPLILLICQGVKGLRGGEGGVPAVAAKRSPPGRSSLSQISTFSHLLPRFSTSLRRWNPTRRRRQNNSPSQPFAQFCTILHSASNART